jgi:predicted transcriptional regulator
VEAVERLVSYDQWFIREVEKGLGSGGSGEFTDHDAVKKLIQQRYPS